jgi:RecA-family ATPase
MMCLRKAPAGRHVVTQKNAKPARNMGIAEHAKARLGRSDRAAIGPPDYTPDGSPDAASFADVMSVVGAVEWLIPNWLPQGIVTGVIAEPKAGKTGFALGGLAAAVLTGGRWFNGTARPEPGAVVFVDTERSAGVNVKRATDCR